MQPNRKFVEDSNAISGVVGVMIGALVAILVFAALAPVVADQVGSGGNLTGGAKALFLLTPLFFVIVGVLLVLKFVQD
jgi:hypothetical protein